MAGWNAALAPMTGPELGPKNTDECPDPHLDGGDDDSLDAKDAKDDAKLRARLAAFDAHLANRGRAPRTRTAFADGLLRFCRWFVGTHGALPVMEEVTSRDVLDFKQHLIHIDRLKPASIDAYLAALRAYYRYLGRSGIPVVDPTVDVRAPKQQRHAPKSLDRLAVAKLRRAAQARIAIADSKRKPSEMAATAAEARRDAAMVVLMLATGVRLSELCALRLSDVEMGARHGTLRVVHGKGDKWRELCLNVDARKALALWLEARPLYAKDGAGEALFVARRGKAISTRSVQLLLRKLAQQAGLEPKDVTPHCLRHTLAKDMVDAGVPLTQVQAALGHDNLQTTARYTTPTVADMQRAFDAVAWAE